MTIEHGFPDGQRDPLYVVPPDPAFTDADDRAMALQLQQLGRVDARPQFLPQLRTQLVTRAAALELGGAGSVPPLQHVVVSTRYRRSSWSRRLRAAVTSVAAAALLTGGGLAAYFHTTAPAPVSAEVILRHVAAALPLAAGDQVVHEIQVTTDNGILGLPPTKYETWTQLDASGVVVKETLYETTVSGVLLRYYVRDGLQLHTFDAEYNLVENITLTTDDAQSLDNDPYSVTKMRQLIVSAQTGNAQDAQLLPPGQIDGVTVDVVKLFDPISKKGQTGAAATGYDTSRYSLLYVDPQTYAIRGVDNYAVDARGTAQIGSSMRVSEDQTVALADAPANTFTFVAPANARVAAEAPLCTIPETPLPITLAQAVAEVKVPPLLLSGDAAGLRLQSITRSQVAQDTTKGLKHTTVTYSYQNASGATFTVQLTSDGPQGPAAAASQPHPKPQTVTYRDQSGQTSTTAVRPVTLTISGTPVNAVYDLSTGGANDNQTASYDDTTTGLTFYASADKLSSTDFFAAIASLVDGRGQPAVVSRLQHELDAAPPIAPVPAPKPYCGNGVG